MSSIRNNLSVKELSTKLGLLEQLVFDSDDVHSIIWLIERTQSKLTDAMKADFDGVWDVLRNGTESEFSALLNCLPDIGGSFYEDDVAYTEIVQIAKNRLANAQNYDNLISGIKGGFGGEFLDIFMETRPFIEKTS